MTIAVVLLSAALAVAALGWASTVQDLNCVKDRLEAKNRLLKEPRAICLCQHGMNFHVEGGGRCEEVTYVHPYISLLDTKCSCKRYTGPEPLPTYYAELG